MFLNHLLLLFLIISPTIKLMVEVCFLYFVVEN